MSLNPTTLLFSRETRLRKFLEILQTIVNKLESTLCLLNPPPCFCLSHYLAAQHPSWSRAGSVGIPTCIVHQGQIDRSAFHLRETGFWTRCLVPVDRSAFLLLFLSPLDSTLFFAFLFFSLYLLFLWPLPSRILFVLRGLRRASRILPYIAFRVGNLQNINRQQTSTCGVRFSFTREDAPLFLSSWLLLT